MIGILAPRRIIVFATLWIAATLFLIYLTFRTNYWINPDPSPRGSKGIFLFLIFGLSVVSIAMLIYIANLVFCGGVGMRIRNGRLIHLFQIYNSIDLRKIISVKLGPDGVFHDVPGTLIVKLAGGRQVYIPTLFYETPVPEMVARLEAHGVKVVASAS